MDAGSSKSPPRGGDGASRTQREGNHYAVLGVPFEALESEIRKTYHSIVRTLHPDRRRPGSGGEALQQFHEVQAAWRCLSEPSRRLLYDLRNFGRSSVSERNELKPNDLDELIQMQKEQAVTDVRNMEHHLERILQHERKQRGIIIRNALYGNLRLKEESYDCLYGNRTIKASDIVGPFIDVTLPVQSLVESHAIVLPGGALASKSDLPGFYNPTPLDPHSELSLYVLYEFKEKLHEVLVGDRETLSLPYRRHAVPAGRDPRGPFAPANVVLMAGAGERTVSASQTKFIEAMIEYRFASLREPGPGDATKGELLSVLAFASLLAGALWWATK